MAVSKEVVDKALVTTSPQLRDVENCPSVLITKIFIRFLSLSRDHVTGTSHT